MKIIGEKLKELRKEKDLTQTKLAEMFYLDKSTVAKYETGEIRPSYEILIKFADYFGVTVDYFLGRED